MANEAELFGLPQVLINFRTQGTTAIKRSARGIVAMILHDGSKNEIQQFRMILSILVDTLNSYKEDSYAAIGRAA